MTFRFLRTLALIPLAAWLLDAQTAQVNGPVTGFVFDQAARALRPILGLPGASTFGDPVALGYDLAAAYVSPRQDAALAVGTDGTLHFLRIDGGAVAEKQVDSLATSPDHVVFSPSGKGAAISAGGSIELLKGLPDSPMVAGGIDLSSGTKLNSLALSDDGAVLLVSTGNAVRLFGSLSDMGKLMDTAGPALLAFAAGGHDAAVVHAAGSGITLFHDLTGAGGSQVLAPVDDTISASSALAFSADGKSLLVASSQGQSVTAFDLTAGARNSIACSCSPKTLAAMGNLFRLNELGADPVWLLDAQASQPRVLFVPALAQ